MSIHLCSIPHRGDYPDQAPSSIADAFNPWSQAECGYHLSTDPGHHPYSATPTRWRGDITGVLPLLIGQGKQSIQRDLLRFLQF